MYVFGIYLFAPCRNGKMLQLDEQKLHLLKKIFCLVTVDTYVFRGYEDNINYDWTVF